MTGKMGLTIGLLIGLIIAIAASLTTMVLVSSDMEQRQAEAYDRGFKEANEKLPESGAKFSAQFNQSMMNQNEQLSNAIDTTRTRLQAFQSRDDLTPSAQDELADIIESMPE